MFQNARLQYFPLQNYLKHAHHSPPPLKLRNRGVVLHALFSHAFLTGTFLA